MKKIKLQLDYEAQRLHLQSSYSKMQILNNAVADFNMQFDEVMDVQLFAENFYDYAINKIRTDNPAVAPLNLSDAKVADLFEKDLTYLKDLTSVYKSNPIELKYDKGTFVVDDSKDYFVYASTPDELKRYELSMNLIKAVNDLRTESDSRFSLNGEIIWKWIEANTEGTAYQPTLFYIKQ